MFHTLFLIRVRTKDGYDRKERRMKNELWIVIVDLFDSMCKRLTTSFNGYILLGVVEYKEKHTQKKRITLFT